MNGSAFLVRIWGSAAEIPRTKLSEMSGFSVSHISMILYGRRNPGPRAAIRISRVLGITTLEFLEKCKRAQEEYLQCARKAV